ncbi:hypothetical protein FZ990_14965 [Clostridium perfringens]|nr:hypothetical protein [Clostridium perfringens]
MIAYEHFVFPKIVGIVRVILNPIVMIPLLFMGYRSVAMTVVVTLVNLLSIGINVYYCFRKLHIKIKFKNLSLD